MRQAFADGIAWGEAKKQLFALVDAELREAREKYNQLLANPAHIEEILQQGAQKARRYSQPFLQQLREAVGVRALT